MKFFKKLHYGKCQFLKIYKKNLLLHSYFKDCVPIETKYSNQNN